MGLDIAGAGSRGAPALNVLTAHYLKGKPLAPKPTEGRVSRTLTAHEKSRATSNEMVPHRDLSVQHLRPQTQTNGSNVAVFYL